MQKLIKDGVIVENTWALIAKPEGEDILCGRVERGCMEHPIIISETACMAREILL